MCLGIPMRIISIDGTRAVADSRGVTREVDLSLVADDVSPGDFVLVHVGYAIASIEEEEARQTLELFEGLISELKEAEDA